MEVAENCKNSKLLLDIRKWILDSYVKPILIHGSKNWTISSEIEQRLQTVEMLKISWTHLMSNQEVLRRAEISIIDDHKKQAA